MAASVDDVKRWINQAIELKQKFIISVCDTWDYDDYPVYCKDEEELRENLPKYSSGANMQKINEVIEILEDGTINRKRSF